MPHSLKPKHMQEFQRMVDLEVIEPVFRPSAWVNSMVIAESNSKLRICVDSYERPKSYKAKSSMILSFGEKSSKNVCCFVKIVQKKKPDHLKNFLPLVISKLLSEICFDHARLLCKSKDLCFITSISLSEISANCFAHSIDWSRSSSVTDG